MNDNKERLQKRMNHRSAKSKKSRAVHNNEEDNRLLWFDVSELLMLAGDMLKTMLTSARGPRKRSKDIEKSPTNRSWFNQANSNFNSIMASFTEFFQSKKELLCGGIATTNLTDMDGAPTCATSDMKNPSDGDYGASASIEDQSEADPKIILSSDKSSDEDYSTSSTEDWSTTSSLSDSDFKIERSKKVSFSASNIYYSGSESKRTRSKDYSKTPKWSSDRCEC